MTSARLTFCAQLFFFLYLYIFFSTNSFAGYDEVQDNIKNIALNYVTIESRKKKDAERFINFYFHPSASFEHRLIVYHPYNRREMSDFFIKAESREDIINESERRRELSDYKLLQATAGEALFSDDNKVAFLASRTKKEYHFNPAKDRARSFFNMMQYLKSNLDEKSMEEILKSEFNIIFDTECNFSFVKSSTFIITGHRCVTSAKFDLDK